MAAIIGEDPAAFELHQETVRAGRVLKKLQADPDASPDVVRAADEVYRSALATLHEKCALEAA